MKEQGEILIVDDEEGMRESLSFILESEGLTRVRTAKDGEQALQELEQQASEVVITDLVMPRLNGYTLMQSIRERWPNTLVIAITGYGSTDSATQCLRWGAFDYVTKPFEMDVILNVIRRALDRVKLEAEARARSEQIAVMAEMTRIINSTLDIQAVYQPFTKEVSRILDFDLMNIALFAEGQSQLRILATTAPETSGLSRGRIVAGQNTLLGAAARSNKDLVRSDLAVPPLAVDEQIMFEEGMNSLLAVPLIVKRRAIGSFCVGSTRPGAFDKENTQAIVHQVGGLVATAANNVLLFDRIQSQLATLRQTQSQLIRSARLAAVGELADGVAHEINNPLSVVLGITQLLMRQDDISAAVKDDLQRIAQSAGRVASIIRTFIDFAKPATSGKQFPVRVENALEASLLLVQTQLEPASRSIRIEKSLPPDIPLVMGNEGQLQGAFVHIVRNAFESMVKTLPPQAGHQLRLQVRVREQAEQQFVEISVEDTGCGIPARDLARIFEPGFTTKVDRGTVRGLGMGLFCAYGTIDVHGGDINIESEPGQGTRVIVALPAIASPA